MSGDVGRWALGATRDEVHRWVRHLLRSLQQDDRRAGQPDGQAERDYCGGVRETIHERQCSSAKWIKRFTCAGREAAK
jgi:hypothetical protein